MKKLLFLLLVSFSCLALTPEQCGYPSLRTASQAIQKAVDSTKSCELLPHTYLIDSTINLPEGCIIKGFGYASVLSTNKNIKVLNAQGSNISLSSFKIGGNYTGNNQIGFNIEGTQFFNPNYSNILISEVWFDQLAKAGIYTIWNMGNTTGAINGSQCIFRGCGVGIWCDTRGEYNSFINCNIFLCPVGFKNKGGNNSLTGCTISGNDIGVWLLKGINDGHCTIEAPKINHNIVSIKVDSLENGYKILGGDIHIGKIEINNSYNVLFKGVTINIDSVKNNNSVGTVFKLCEFTTTPKFTGITPNFFTNEFIEGVPVGYTEVLLNPSVKNGTYIYFYGNENTDGSYRLGMLNDSYVNQIRISGDWITIQDFTAKYTPDSQGRQFVDVESKSLKNDNGHTNIRLNSSWILKNGYIRWDWTNQYMYDENQILSGSFIERTFNDNSGVISLDYQGKKLHGDWKIKSPDNTWFKIKVDNDGILYTTK